MYFIALRGNTPPRIQEGISANTDVIRGKEVSFFCAASGKYVVDTNYFNISEIWFLVVDFRAYVGLPLITETLKFQCNHHYSIAICGCLKCTFSSSGSFGFRQTFD